jgi:hypothetical protein
MNKVKTKKDVCNNLCNNFKILIKIYVNNIKLYNDKSGI